MSKREPVRILAEVPQGSEAVRCHAGTDMLDAATVRYLSIERGNRTLAMWINKRTEEYGPWSIRWLPS